MFLIDVREWVLFAGHNASMDDLPQLTIVHFMLRFIYNPIDWRWRILYFGCLLSVFCIAMWRVNIKWTLCDLVSSNVLYHVLCYAMYVSYRYRTSLFSYVVHRTYIQLPKRKFSSNSFILLSLILARVHLVGFVLFHYFSSLQTFFFLFSQTHTFTVADADACCMYPAFIHFIHPYSSFSSFSESMVEHTIPNKKAHSVFCSHN